MKLVTLSVAAFLTISMYSCTKSSSNTNTTTTGTTTGTTTTTNNSGSAKLDYQLKTSNNSSGLRTTATGTINWISGFANPSMVKFEAKQGTTEIEFKSLHSGHIDLMSPTAIYFGSFTLPAGTYSETEFKIQLSKTTDPALQLNGQFVSGATTIPVVFQVSEALELKTEQHNVTVDSTGSFTGITTLDLSALSAGVTADALLSATLTSGTLVISSSVNTAIYNTIISNFRHKDHHFEVEHHH